MIEQLTYIETDNTHPYKNLAVEEYLLSLPGKRVHFIPLAESEHCSGGQKSECLERVSGKSSGAR